MAATYTLGKTTFTAAVGQGDPQVKVASTSGLTPGMRLFCERELMRVVSLGVSSLVNVQRGVDGTLARPHDTMSTVYVGSGDQFHHSDPQGRPPDVVLNDPWINVLTGDIWFADGDGGGVPNGDRWWRKQIITRSTDPLGVRSWTPDITASK